MDKHIILTGFTRFSGFVFIFLPYRKEERKRYLRSEEKGFDFTIPLF